MSYICKKCGAKVKKIKTPEGVRIVNHGKILFSHDSMQLLVSKAGDVILGTPVEKIDLQTGYALHPCCLYGTRSIENIIEQEEKKGE
jgi:hypothetical protein